MKTNHTPGPWRVKKRKMDARIFGNVDGGPIATVHYVIENASNPHDEANARLIAAAPELLEALELLVAQEDWYREEVPPESPVGKAYAAIAKARGTEGGAL